MPMERLTPSIESSSEDDFSEERRFRDNPERDAVNQKPVLHWWRTFHWWGAGQFPDPEVEHMYKKDFEQQAAQRVARVRSYLLPLVVWNGAAQCCRQVLDATTSRTRHLILFLRMLLYAAVALASPMTTKQYRAGGRLPYLRVLYCSIVCVNAVQTLLSQCDQDTETSSLFVNIVCDVLVGVSVCSNIEEPLYATWLTALIHPTLSLAGVHAWRDDDYFPPLLVSVLTCGILTRIYTARRRDFLQSLLHRGVLPAADISACLPAYSRSTSMSSNFSEHEPDGSTEVSQSWTLVHDNYYSKEDAQALASIVQAEEEGMRWKEECGERLAEFQPWQEIGSGGFGRVFVGVDRRSQQKVALKNLGAGKRAQRELRFTLKLSHPNVVAYRGHFQGEGGSLSLLLEYCKGGSLDELLRRVGPVVEDAVRVLAGDLLGGLGYLHRHGMAHRDVKPGNMLITEEGVLKLGDMGSVQYVSETPPRHRITIIYSAPEALREDCNPRLADIWSVGCSAVEALSQQVPHFGRMPVASSEYLTFVQKCSTPPTLPSSLSPLAVSFAQACVQVEPQRRLRVPDLVRHPFVLDRRHFPLGRQWMESRRPPGGDLSGRPHGQWQTETVSVENRRSRSEDWGGGRESWPTRLWALLGGLTLGPPLSIEPYKPDDSPGTRFEHRSY